MNRRGEWQGNRAYHVVYFNTLSGLSRKILTGGINYITLCILFDGKLISPPPIPNISLNNDINLQLYEYI